MFNGLLLVLALLDGATSLKVWNATSSLLNTSVQGDQYISCTSESSCSTNTGKIQHDFNKHELILIFGCSLDIQAIAAFCIAGGIATSENDILTQAPMSYLSHCTVGTTTFAYVFHPGAGSPPYSHHYNAAIGTTKDIVTRSKADVVKMFGKEPDAVVVDASLWDVSSWWDKLGKPPSPYPVPEAYIRVWCDHEVPTLLGFVAGIFTNSHVAYRTAPTILDSNNDYGQTPQNLDAMVHCIEIHKNQLGQVYGSYGLIDYHHFVDALLAQPGAQPLSLYKDILHPGAHLSLLYINNILTWAHSVR